MTISSHNNFHILRKILRKPESNIPLFAIGPIQKIVNPLKHKYNFIIDGIDILERLVLDSLVADIEPIREIFPDFLLVELNLLANIELFPQLDENSIDCVEVVAIVAACGCKVEDGQIASILRIK